MYVSTATTSPTRSSPLYTAVTSPTESSPTPRTSSLPTEDEEETEDSTATTTQIVTTGANVIKLFTAKIYESMFVISYSVCP